MTQYNQSSIVKAAENLGYTALDLVKAVPSLREWSVLGRATDEEILTGKVEIIAWNRATDQKCDQWLEQIQSKPRKASREYREVASPLYGAGRVYADQPGATQYLGARGEYSVQIWDES